MARNRDIANTVGDTQFGSSLDDLAKGDLERGYFDAGPRGNYEGSLDPTVTYDYSDDGMERVEGGTLHAGMIEPDMFKATHGSKSEYGFVRRPERGSDVERN